MANNTPKMMRDNGGKPKLSFILSFPNMLEQVARVMEDGADKYERDNWKIGGPITECEDSLLRHLEKFHNCEDDDHESGMSHLAHVVVNACFILENYHRYGADIDDRDWDNADV